MNVQWINPLTQFGSTSVDLVLTETTTIGKTFKAGYTTDDLNAEAAKEVARLQSERSELAARAAKADEYREALVKLLAATDAGLALIMSRAQTDADFLAWAVNGLVEFNAALAEAKGKL